MKIKATERKPFKVGNIYGGSFVNNADHWVYYKVIKRTEKTVWFQQTRDLKTVEGKVISKRVKPTHYNGQAVEACKILVYLTSDRPVTVATPEQQVKPEPVRPAITKALPVSITINGEMGIGYFTISSKQGDRRLLEYANQLLRYHASLMQDKGASLKAFVDIEYSDGEVYSLKRCLTREDRLDFTIGDHMMNYLAYLKENCDQPFVKAEKIEDIQEFIRTHMID